MALDDLAASIGTPIESVPHRFGRHPLQKLSELIARSRESDDDSVGFSFDLDAGAFAQSGALRNVFRNAHPQTVPPTRDLHLHRIPPSLRIYMEYTKGPYNR